MASWATSTAGAARTVAQRLARHARRAATGAATTMVDLVFLRRCEVCHTQLDDEHREILVCEECEAELVDDDTVRCRRCGAKGADAGSARCRHCRRVRLWIDSVIALGDYDGLLRAAVLRTKMAGHEGLAATLGSLLAKTRCAPLTELAADVVVAVPMHWSRRFERGSDSVGALAARLAHDLCLPSAAGALLRRRNTPVQNGLLREQRFQNVRGAFRTRAGYDFQGARILLVDDILTTGATASEAARTLKRSGASRVTSVVAARTTGLD